MNFNRMTVFWLSVCSLFGFCQKAQSFLYNTPGETWPQRVEIEVNGSASIFCQINLSAFQKNTVRDLYFIDTMTQKIVPKSNVTIINETTIEYTLKNAPEQQTTYRCKCGDSAIADIKVFVGSKPTNVTDFACRAYDFQSIVCNFTKPYNPVLCKYNLSYYFDAAENYKFYPKCDYDKSSLFICEAPVAKGGYRSNEEIYHYELHAANKLGVRIQRFDINSTEIMIPAKPGQDFRVTQITTDSAIFTFRMLNYQFYRAKGLQWDLILKPQNLSESRNSSFLIRPPSRAGNEFTLRLQHLPYACYEYQMRLRVRLQGANAWSEPFVYKFRTAPRLPDRAPRIDVGGFYIDPSEKFIHLYWELLQPYEFNGYNFSYLIEDKFGNMLTTDSNSASFAWQKGLPFEFKIRSKNHLGSSLSFSTIKTYAMLPASKSKAHTTPAVHNIYHEKNGTFTLTWEAPEASNGLEDYTIFWCRPKRALLNGCEGSIHFKHVARNVHKFTTEPQEHTLNLAVSANYKDFNTGMHWTECTMNEESDLVKMEPEVEVLSATSIKIQWTEKICPSIFDGFNLSYCEIAESEMALITEIESDDFLDDDTTGVQYKCRDDHAVYHERITKTLNRFELRNLKPFTWYKIEMFMFSSTKVGRTSKPQIRRTFEDAPSKPLQLNYSHKTNTSVLLSWLPPSEPNGIIRSYTILFNNERREVHTNLLNNFGRINFELKNLNSSTDYQVNVTAHTLSSSEPSSNIYFKTLVGYPKPPSLDTSAPTSTTDTEIKWAESRDRTDFYEVAITILQNDEIVRRRISVIVGSNSCAYVVPPCFDPTYRTTVHIRAVNAALLSREEDDERRSIESLDNSLDEFYKNNVDQDKQYYTGNEDLICASTVVGANDKQITNMQEVYENYLNTDLYRLYKSSWLDVRVYNCATTALGKFFIYSASAILMAVGVFVLLYVLRRKYIKMSNIHCTLPAGLDAYVSKEPFSAINCNGNVFPHDFLTVIKGETSTNSRCEEDVEPTTIGASKTRTNDCHNEERRLLETTSQDSISLNEQPISTNSNTHNSSLTTATAANADSKIFNEIGIASNPMFDSNFDLTFEPSHMTKLNDHKTDDSNESTNVVGAASTVAAYIQANNFTMPHYPLESTPTANGYIKPNNLTNWQNIVTKAPSPLSVSPSSLSSGYVTVESVENNSSAKTPTIKSILPSALQNFTATPHPNSGYVQANINARAPATVLQSSPAVVPHAQAGTTTDSYTTLEQLGKMSSDFSNVDNWHSENDQPLTQDLGIPLVLPANVTPGISGYVTPRELTAFGQQQQRQQNFH